MNYDTVVKKLFDSFYSKIYGDGRGLSLIERNKTYIHNFKINLSKLYLIDSIGPGWLLHYFAWAFNYWYLNGEMRSTKRKITLNWVVGKKMLTRYHGRDRNSDYYVGTEIIETLGIDLDEIHRDLCEQEHIDHGLDPAEENEKARFVGDARLYNCLAHTTLFDNRSITCFTCEHKVTCKGFLEKKFPKTYIKRGYAAEA